MSEMFLCVEGGLLFFYHISNGEKDIVTSGFTLLYFGIPLALILLGLLLSLKGHNSVISFMTDGLPVMIYITLRLVCGIVNNLTSDPVFWKQLCYEALLLIGISTVMVRTRTVHMLLCELLAFDLIVVSICTFHYVFLNEDMVSAVTSFPAQHQNYIPFTFVFNNPNPAGMLSGISAAISILTFKGSSKGMKLLMAPVILINIIFMIWSNSRTSIVGIVIVTALVFFKSIIKINYKSVIAASLIICAVFMLPVYIIAFSSDPTDRFRNTEIEESLNEASSGRYNTWKSHILSQKGHYLLGFGTASKAVKARSNYLKTVGESETAEMDIDYQEISENNVRGVHNGYMELVLVAGIPAAVVAILILILKIKGMNNMFIDRHPVVLLLVMLFWICVQESRFITSSAHYIAFIMMVLLNWRDDEEKGTF